MRDDSPRVKSWFPVLQHAHFSPLTLECKLRHACWRQEIACFLNNGNAFCPWAEGVMVLLSHSPHLLRSCGIGFEQMFAELHDIVWCHVKEGNGRTRLSRRRMQCRSCFTCGTIGHWKIFPTCRFVHCVSDTLAFSPIESEDAIVSQSSVWFPRICGIVYPILLHLSRVAFSFDLWASSVGATS